MKRFILFFAAAIFLTFIPQKASAAGNQLIIINKSTNELAFFDNGELVRTFSVGTGRTNGLTPEGTFPIVNKIKNRPYYTGGIAGGSPNNPLGVRWLGLKARGTNGTTYAIHGNNDPSSIGKYVSAGCVRMHNDDVSWLFERIQIGTNAVILNSSKSFNEIAKEKGYQLKEPVKVLVDGKEIQTTKDAFLENGRVLVPMRSIFQELGANVQWKASTSTVTATKNSKTVQLKIGSKHATINGRSTVLDVTPKVYEGVTFVPTRFVSEALGVQVKWDQSKRTVFLTTPKAPSKTAVTVAVNGKKLQEKGFLTEGRTFTPVREVATLIGATISYDGKTSTLTLKDQNNVLVLKANNKQATLNGQAIILAVAPVVENGQFYAPIASIVSIFNGSTKFDSKTNTVNITLPVK